MQYYQGSSSYESPPPYSQRNSLPFAPNLTSHTPAYPPGVHPPNVGYYHHPSQPYNSPQYHAGPSRSRGTDYLLSIQNGMTGLALNGNSHVASTSVHSTPSPGRDKPLPRLPPPPPPIPPRPYSTSAADAHAFSTAETSRRLTEHGRPPENLQHNRYSTPLRVHTPHYATSLPSNPSPLLPHAARPVKSTPPQAFRASTTLLSPKLYPPHSEPRLSRLYSESTVSTISPTKALAQVRKAPRKKVHDVTYIDSDTDSSDGDTPVFVTSRSPARRKRTTSEQPLQSRPLLETSSRSNTSTPTKSRTPKKGDGPAVQCSGFTQTGAPCKRLVKAKAPFVALSERNGAPCGENRGDKEEILDKDDKEERRYCKDHAGMICGEPGFCWQGDTPAKGVYVEFNGFVLTREFIPTTLSQQTQTLLRLTMENPLTAKDMPGFLYAYELRDLRTPNTSFFKVGRTENVPRRIVEWTKGCRSHAPTMRDLFPIPPTSASFTINGPQRTPTLPSSFLPGARRQSTNPARRCPAMKRWERLVHIELADLASQHAPMEYASLKEKCVDCGRVHQEIFALGNGDKVYEERVKDVVLRWEKFVRKICEN